MTNILTSLHYFKRKCTLSHYDVMHPVMHALYSIGHPQYLVFWLALTILLSMVVGSDTPHHTNVLFNDHRILRLIIRLVVSVLLLIDSTFWLAFIVLLLINQTRLVLLHNLRLATWLAFSMLLFIEYNLKMSRRCCYDHRIRHASKYLLFSLVVTEYDWCLVCYY